MSGSYDRTNYYNLLIDFFPQYAMPNNPTSQEVNKGFFNTFRTTNETQPVLQVSVAIGFFFKLQFWAIF